MKMKNLSSRIISFFVNRQFIKFALVGALGTTLDYTAYLSLTRFLGVWYLFASVVGFGCGLINNFFWNKYWTFARKESGEGKRQFVKFFIVSVLGVALGNVLLFCLVEWCGFYDIVARVMTTGIVMLWNFSANKVWTFRSRSEIAIAEVGQR